MPEKGRCLKCHRTCLLTQHHIIPKTHRKADNHQVVRLCATCHMELEQRILEMEGSKKGKRNKLPEEMYFQILLNFLAEEDYGI